MFHRYTIAIFFCFLYVSFPTFVSASVYLNEIAWMGTSVSGANEWIELANDSGGATDLSGWRIEAGDQSIIIPLSGTIEGNGLYLIERTDDKTVPNILADFIAPFGKGLGNFGMTLFLRDAQGSIVDAVVGGADWKNIGGDNTTKETAQRIHSGAGDMWKTGQPTPRAKNVSDALSSGSSAERRSTSSLVIRDADAQAYVGIPFLFQVDEHEPGVGQSSTTSEWNFGDGATGEGMIVSHIYQFAGTYTVVFRVWNGISEEKSSTRIVVSQTPISISRASSDPSGFVELENRSMQDIDISGWILSSRTNGQSFVFPERTYLSANQKTLFPNSVTGIQETPEGVLLSLRDGTRTAEGTRSLGSTVLQVESVNSQSMRRMPVPILPAQSTSSVLQHAVHSGEPLGTSSSAATLLWERTPGEPSLVFGRDASGKLSWFLVGIGMIFLIFAGLVVLRSGADKPSLADEYAIVSDLIEGDEDEVR